jgi:hypothetical protein
VIGSVHPPLPIRRIVQQVSLAAGRITCRARMLPSFLIVGAQRCGTTSLYRALSVHPGVVKPVLHKGVHYFDVAYDRGPAWYRAHFPVAAVASLASRTAGVAPVTFESSPYYLFHPLAAERIHNDLADIKLLVLIRDPVERAYSAHAHELARGFETEPFEPAIELEESRLAGQVERIQADPSYLSHSHQHHAYRARGRYCDQLERLERLFGRDRMYVIESAEFFARPRRVFDSVLDFLGLPPGGYPAFKRHNDQPRAPMSAVMRQKLEEYFLPHDERLAAWLGHDPSWRR